MSYQGRFKQENESKTQKAPKAPKPKGKAVKILSAVLAVLVLIVAVMIACIVYRLTMEYYAAQRPEPVVTEWVPFVPVTESLSETQISEETAALAETESMETTSGETLPDVTGTETAAQEGTEGSVVPGETVSAQTTAETSAP